MSEHSTSLTKLPPEQQAIRDRCFHPSGTFVEFPMEDVETSIPARFEKIVGMYPNRLALKMGQLSLTYDQLNRAANQAARAILAIRGSRNEPVALLFENSIDSIISVLGVLKAGKFYVGLDPSNPVKRNDAVLRDSGAHLVVTNDFNSRLGQHMGHDGARVININRLGDSFPSDNLGLEISSANFASIIYTSGSTGTPKGVVGTHRNVLQSMNERIDELRVTIDDRLVLLHAVSYGLSIEALFESLLNGASLFPHNIKSNAISGLAQWLITERITLWYSAPAAFRQLAESIATSKSLRDLRLISLSGAPISKHDFDLYKKKFSAQTLLRVSMGSTEARVISSVTLDHGFAFPTDGAPVGYPPKGKTILLFDENRMEVKPGGVGEIAVKGKNLTNGYWNQPDLTAEKFLPDPQGGPERMYLTGDLGRMLPDGFLIYLGRKDLMVKVRGYPVELSEVEQALVEHPMVKEAGVAAWDRDSGEKYLAGYVVPRQGPALNVSGLNEFLRKKLPDYMIPSAYVFLDTLPLINGKLDRKALRKPDYKRPELSTPYVYPRNGIEKQLVRIWEEALEIRPVGIHDNFFDLGGHSLAASRVISAVQAAFGIELSIKELLKSSLTIAEMALVLTEHQATQLSKETIEQMVVEIDSVSEEEARHMAEQQKF